LTFQALLVDFGGVLTTSMMVSIAAFCESTGVEPEAMFGLLAGAYGGTEPAHEIAGLVTGLETGRLAVEEFDRRLAEALSEGLPEPLDPDGLSARLFQGLQPDQPMVEAVRAARSAGIKTGLISNTWGPTAASEHLADLFDVEIRSWDVGLRKPEPEIYLEAARRLEIDPEACVFVDDIQANAEGARAVGMWAVVHRDAALTIPKLEELLGVPLA
jgi:putative hydrolase of the HAD superfamily